MYRKVEQAGSPPFDFELPLAGKLAEDNRWAIVARLILWSEFEAEYAQNFAGVQPNRFGWRWGR